MEMFVAVILAALQSAAGEGSSVADELAGPEGEAPFLRRPALARPHGRSGGIVFPEANVREMVGQLEAIRQSDREEAEREEHDEEQEGATG